VIVRTPVRASRSDAYDFIMVPDINNVPMIIAGCRYFTVAQAFQHWNINHPKFDETMLIINYLIAAYELQQKSLKR